ncbi:NitT/TauT family transport system substrate-binding protein [Thermosyntropha lipolytica DSM 11003]|uniref:NitT/TauT family transport system substrate-binding protein n=1 Tax=Thermosyntropha lipolytica DSM 11003 TaxID=1123382 RepID=A0A1M5JQG0_9FIRM|nr:ABC transporter substrate-binding subunit SaoX [Thermosyntropha lipolytica]SHG42645.1 NitT/TauT family transport system substrate-binding protein [Thermosyntropha lipolytica DSM 11003]
MKRNYKWLTLLLLLVFAVSITGCGGTKPAAEGGKDDYVVKLGYYNCDHMIGAVVGEAAGIYEQMGLKVKLFGNGKVPQAMAAGQMDVGYIGTRGLMASRPKGAPIKVAANNHIGGSMYLVVANDIKSPQDLIGQPLGIGNEPEKSEDWPVYAKTLGIPVEGSNYKCIEFDSDQAAYLALKTGQIKGFTCCDPWASMAEYEGTGYIMATYMEMMTGDEKQMGSCCVYSMNENFKKEHPELARKMVQAHVEALKYVYTHPIKSARIFAEYYHVPEEVALRTIYKKCVAEGRTLTWKIDEGQMRFAMKVYQNEKLMDEVPAYEDVIDIEFYKSCNLEDFDKFIKEKVDPVFPVGMSYEDWKKKAKEIDA